MTRLKNVLAQIWSDISQGENLDSYITIIVGVALTFVGIVGGLSQARLNAAFSLVLTLLIVNILNSRHLIQRTTKAIVEKASFDAARALRDRSEYSSLEDRLSGASSVYIFGRNLLGFIGFNRDILLRSARLGCRFQIVLYSEAICTTSQDRDDLRTTMRILEELRVEVPLGFEIRSAAFQFPCSILAIDVDRPQALIQVQPHSLHSDNELRPHFDLYASAENPRWFEYYRAQVEQLWGSSVAAVI